MPISLRLMSMGFPGGNGPVDHKNVAKVMNFYAAYGACFERCVALSKFYDSEGPTEDPGRTNVQTDFESATPFADAIKGKLFNFVPVRVLGKMENDLAPLCNCSP
jgi:hypothetical protein